MRYLGKVTCIKAVLLFALAFSIEAAQFDQLGSVRYIYSGSSPQKRHFVFIAGNPLAIVGEARKDVEHKFEKSALFASKLRHDDDHAIFLFYKDQSDKNWEGRMRSYETYLELGWHEFIPFSSKQEIVDFLAGYEDGPINGIFFFVHSFPHGLNIGKKPPDQNENDLLSDEEKRSMIKNDPQYLYIPNFKKETRKNISDDARILLAGCRTSLEVNIFRQAEKADIENASSNAMHPSNYLVYVRYNSFAKRLADLLNAKVLSTEHYTHFETSDNGGKTFRPLKEGEKPAVGDLLLMYPDHGQMRLSYPHGKISAASQTSIMLKPMPLQPYSPSKLYGNFLSKLGQRKRSGLSAEYENKLKDYRQVMIKYREDFAKLSLEMKSKYKRELKLRKKLLAELLDKERKYALNKTISIEAIYWYRSHYGKKIAEMREKMSFPPLKMLFRKNNEKNPAYYFGGKFYSEFETFTDFLDL